MQPDMWSGWGIRTLSAEHPAYNPFSYQNGSVWPHDNGFIAVGFKRYGFTSQAAQIARAVSEAGSFFMLHQLPELYAGVQRDSTNFPIQYLGANVPQAWAAGSVFALLEAILGFQPDAKRGRLYIDPVLPAWLPDLTLSDLRLGKQVFDLRFQREGEETHLEVLRGDPKAVLLRSIVAARELSEQQVSPIDS
jgi:glycogen debranching enzyme